MREPTFRSKFVLPNERFRNVRRTPGGGNELKRIYGPDLHSDYRHSGSTGRLRPLRRRHQRRRKFPQLGYRIEGGPPPRDPDRGIDRNPGRHAHVERHDGGGAQRNVRSGDVLLPRGDPALSERDVRQHHSAGPLQFVGASHLDHRVAHLLPAGRRDRRFDLQDRRQRRTFDGRPGRVHPHGPRIRHRRGDPALGGHRADGRYGRDVRLPPDLLVPLHAGPEPLRRAVVRRIAHGNHLLRTLQGTQRNTIADGLHPYGREPYHPLATGLLAGMQPHPLLRPAFQDQHPAHHDPGRHLRPRARLRRKRSGELHRRTDRRLGRLPDRPPRRRLRDDDGCAQRERSGQLRLPRRCGRGDDPHALDVAQGDARHRNRTLAGQPERRAGAAPAPSSARRSTPTMPSSGSFPNGSARRSPAASK